MPGAAGRAARAPAGSLNEAAGFAHNGAPITEGDMLTGATVLAAAFGILILIWILILWGSRYFGSEH